MPISPRLRRSLWIVGWSHRQWRLCVIFSLAVVAPVAGPAQSWDSSPPTKSNGNAGPAFATVGDQPVAVQTFPPSSASANANANATGITVTDPTYAPIVRPGEVTAEGAQSAAPSAAPSAAQSAAQSAGASTDNSGTGDATKPEDKVASLIDGFQLRVGDMQFKIGGYVKFDAIYDFQDAGISDYFDPNTIPFENAHGAHSRWHARQSRLTLDVRTDTSWGQAKIYVEGDFFGTGNAFRLRHAYGELGHWLAGQAFSTLFDPDGFLDSLDFNGPSGNALFRTAQLRWSSDWRNNWRWIVSIEEPNNNVVAPIPGEFRARMPSLVSALHRRWNSGHIYVSGSVGEARHFDVDQIESTAPTWAGIVTLVHRFGKNRLVAKYGASKGFVLFGQHRDIQVTPQDGIHLGSDGIETPLTQGYVVGLERRWNDHFRTATAIRSGLFDNLPEQEDDALHGNHYFLTNLIWSPLGTNQFDVGIEYLWGQRENKNGATRDAHRLQMSMIYHIR